MICLRDPDAAHVQLHFSSAISAGTGMAGRVVSGPAAQPIPAAVTGWGHELRALWAFDPEMIFLNQGAFGATLRELMVVQTEWRDRMERQTARFFMGDLPKLIREAATELAQFLGADPDRTVMVENASSGIMAVLLSQELTPGDEIVLTSHVYGAVRQAVRHVAARTGARIVEVAVPVPVAGPQDFVSAIAAAITPRARLIVVDHVASPSSLILPVAQIVALARQAGVCVVIDGSHAPGLLALDLNALDADYYVGNCHKWLCNPKGAGFIVLGRAAAQAATLHPVTISHAYGQGVLAEFGKIGTRDPSAWLTVPSAIAAHERLGGAALRARNADMTVAACDAIATHLGTELAGPAAMFAAMVSLRLPPEFGAARPETAAALREALWQSARIEALILPLHGALWLRLCGFAYNAESDFAAVAQALDALRDAAAREAGA